MNQFSSRISAVSLAKGIGIVGVVAHHIANRRFDYDAREVIGLLGSISGWAVPLFILISGYLHGNSTNKISFIDFLKARLRRLVLPFVLMALVYSVVLDLLIIRGWFTGYAGEYRPWYESWAASLIGNGGVGEQLYFLPVLFVISLISFSVSRYVSRFKIARWILVVSMWFFAFSCEFNDVIYYWSFGGYIAGVALYLAGIFLSENPRNGFAYFFGTSSVLCLVSFVFSNPFAFNFIYPCVLFSGLLFLGVRMPWLERIGDSSGTIYLYHTPFLIQPLVILVALKLPDYLHILGAYGAMLLVILVLSRTHFLLLKSRLNFFAF